MINFAAVFVQFLEKEPFNPVDLSSLGSVGQCQFFGLIFKINVQKSMKKKTYISNEET